MTKSDNEDSPEKNQEKVDRLFDRAAPFQLRARSGFEERVLAGSRRQCTSASRRLPIWRAAAVSAFAFVLGVFGASYFASKNVFEIGTFEEVAISLDLHGHASDARCKIRVDLPTGVRFSSEVNPEIGSVRFLELKCDSGGPMLASLPIVLQGTEEGLKKISVRFVTPDQHELSHSEFKIRFRKGAANA